MMTSEEIFGVLSESRAEFIARFKAMGPDQRREHLSEYHRHARAWHAAHATECRTSDAVRAGKLDAGDVRAAAAKSISQAQGIPDLFRDNLPTPENTRAQAQNGSH